MLHRRSVRLKQPSAPSRGRGHSARARSIDIESARQSPFAPADAGAQALLQKLGSRIRGNERGDASVQDNHALVFWPRTKACWEVAMILRRSTVLAALMFLGAIAPTGLGAQPKAKP